MGDPAPLASAFLALMEARRARELAPRADAIEHALRRAEADGRAAWPEVPLDAVAFAQHVADRVRTRADVVGAIRALHPADLFLACACARGIPAALARFERAHLSRVPELVRRVDAWAAFAEEVAQIVREALLVPAQGRASRIAEYSGRGPLASWVRVVAVRTALHLRDEQRGLEPLEDGGGGEVPGIVDPELDYLKLRYRRVYEEALRAALAELSDRDALLLQLHYVDGLNIDRIGALFGIHRSTVARWRTTIRRSLLARTREHLRRRMRFTPAEFESLLRLVRSQLVVSIRSALRRPSADDPPLT